MPTNEKKEKKEKVENVEKSEVKEKDLKVDPFDIIICPVMSEKAQNLVERENKLTFFVKLSANKKTIKLAVEKLFDVKVEKVNVMMDGKGRKKAYVKLSKESNAMDVATKLGML